MRIARKLRTAVIVIIITAIVWVIADRSVLRTSPELAVDVVVKCTNPNYRVTVVEPEGKVMTGVRFTGPGRGIDRVMALTGQEGPQRLKWQYDLSPKEAVRAASRPQYAVPAKEGFADLAAEYRVTLARSDLSQVIVRVEAVDRKPVTVSLLPADKEQLADGYVIEDTPVFAVGDKAELEKLTGTVVELNLNTPRFREEQLATLKPVPANLKVTFEPAKIMVRNLRLFSTPYEDKEIAGPVRIWIKAVPEVLEQYYVQLDPPTVANLTVSAPRSYTLKAEDVEAVLELAPDERPNPPPSPDEPPTPKEGLLKISFPNHKDVRLKGNPPRVTYRLIQRPAPAAE